MRFLAGLFTASVLLVATCAQAVQMPSIYQVSVEQLTSDENQAREKALSRAFSTVVWRLTGVSNLEDYPQLKQHSADPQDLVTGYNHRDTTLTVRFDAASVLNALQQQGLATWGAQRPVLLLWWTQRDTHGQQLFSDGQLKAESIAKHAEHNGLPVRFPMADLQEQMLTDRLQLTQDAEQVEQLMQRYAGDVFLRVVVEQEPQPTALWQLYEQGKVRQGKVEASKVDDLPDAVFFQLANYFVHKYAVLPGQGEVLKVQVNDLTMQRLVTVENLLQVYNAKLVRLVGQQGVWQVKALPEQLRSLFALQHMRELPVSENESSALPVVVESEQLSESATESESASNNEVGTGKTESSKSVQDKVDLLFGW